MDNEIKAFRTAYELYCSEFEYVGREKAGQEFDEFVRSLRAAAWDEGYIDGAFHGLGPLAKDNPYREEQ